MLIESSGVYRATDSDVIQFSQRLPIEEGSEHKSERADDKLTNITLDTFRCPLSDIFTISCLSHLCVSRETRLSLYSI